MCTSNLSQPLPTPGPFPGSSILSTSLNNDVYADKRTFGIIFVELRLCLISMVLVWIDRRSGIHPHGVRRSVGSAEKQLNLDPLEYSELHLVLQLETN